MFERYTDNARQSIFFARYEASQFSSGFIEPEHLLLALLRESTGLASRLLRSSPAAAEYLRSDIEGNTKPIEKVSTSIDVPLSHACKRVLAYASEEAERLANKHIDTEHLLLGILREEKSHAAELLRERGITLDFVREKAHPLKNPSPQRGPALVASLEKWLAQREASAGTWTIERQQVGNGISYFAIYKAFEPKEKQMSQEDDPSKVFAEIRKRHDFVCNELNRAIVNHEFEKARSYSEESRKQREIMRLLRKQAGFEEPPLPIPFLRIEIISDDRLSEIQKRCDGYIAEGVAEVWLLNAALKRAYTVKKAEGLCEFKGDVLRAAGAVLEMDLKEIFN